MSFNNGAQSNVEGSVRRFGETGPIYEVMQVREDPPGHKIADILLPESNQRATLPLEMVQADPEVV